MNKLIRPAILIVVSLTLAILSAALTKTIQPGGQGNLSAAAFLLQTTPTPEQVDQSEVGSTDGIAVMGFILVAIVVLPILLRRKAWNQTEPMELSVNSYARVGAAYSISVIRRRMYGNSPDSYCQIPVPPVGIRMLPNFP